MKTSSLRFAAVCVAASLAVMSAPHLQAAPLFWDGTVFTDNGASGGGAGTWSTGTAAWDSAAVDGSALVWTSGNDAVFAGTAGTVTLGSAINAEGITFNTASYMVNLAATTNVLTLGSLGIKGNQNATLQSTVTGGSIVLAASQTWDFTGRTLTFGDSTSTTLTSLTVSSASAEVLTFMGTMRGQANFSTTISSQIRLGASSTINSAANSTFFQLNGGVNLNGFNLTLGARNTNTGAGSTITGKITGAPASGAGIIVQSDIASQSLTGVNSNWRFSNNTNDYTGPTTINSGRLEISEINALGAIGTGNGTTVNHAANGGGTLLLSGGRSFAAEDLTIAGNGWFVDQGALYNKGGNNTWNGTITLTNTTNNRINAVTGNTLTLAGAISGANPLEINGTSNSTGYATAGGSGASGVIVTPAGIVSATAASTGFSGTVTVTNGTFRVGGAGSLGASGALSSAVTISSGATLDVNTTGSQTLSGTITGAGTLSQTGVGSLSVTGNNAATFSGPVNVSAGTLLVGHDSALGTGTVTLSGGSVRSLTAARVVSNPVTISGNLTSLGADNAGATPKLTLAGPVTLSGTTQWQVNNGINNQNLEISGAIGGTGGILRSGGSGSMTLSGSNNFSGGFTWAAGSVPQLVIANNSALGTGAVAFTNTGGARINTGSTAIVNSNNNALSFSGNIEHVGTASLNLGTGNVNLNSGTRTFTVTANTLTLGGVVDGGGISKAGAGTLELGGANTYTGTTTVTAGTLRLLSTGSTGTGDVAVQSGGTILGTGTVKGITFTAQTGSNTHAGDSTAAGSFGTLTFTPASGSGTFDFQSGSQTTLGLNPGGSSDKLIFDGLSSGTLNFNGLLTITAPGFAPVTSQTFDLLDWTNLSSTTFASRYQASSYSGLLLGNGDDNLGFDLPDISSSGYGWDISRFTTLGIISTSVIPEPSRMLLLAVGLLTVLFRRKRAVEELSAPF